MRILNYIEIYESTYPLPKWGFQVIFCYWEGAGGLACSVLIDV